MRIYTKTGDDGSTGLIGGARVGKNDSRIECYGTIDELNAACGLASVSAPDDLVRKLRKVQNDLFAIAAHVAVTDEKTPANVTMPVIDDSMVSALESQIDDAERELTPLRNFILPGGGETSARLHLARTICRRAERLLVTLAQSHATSPVILRYLNRLSDWLFVQARLANYRAGVADIPWTK